MKLRYYQRDAIDALYSYWKDGGENGIIALPTAAGKSLVIAQLCKELLADYPALRIGIVTHVKELIKQNYTELVSLWPDAPAGIYSAGLARRDASKQILLCGIQSVWNKDIGAFDLVLIDEAHLVPENSSTTYRRFIDRLQDATPDMKVVGLTATAFRMKSGSLTSGDDKIFDSIVYEIGVRELINKGFLSNLTSKATETHIDVSNVGTRGGDFIPGQLEIAADQEWITKAAVKEIAEAGADRKGWIVFCAGVSHAINVRNEIRNCGFTCETVSAETSRGERDRIIDGFRAQRIRCLTNVGIIGTGFNAPHVDLIAGLRPTQSAGLFVQHIGRGFRLFPGKADCKVLDFAQNTERHGPVDLITADSVRKKGKGDGQPLVKTCPNCREQVAISCMECPACGHIWERTAVVKHFATATKLPILSLPPRWLAVDGVKFYHHEKAGGKPSVKIRYTCGISHYNEWVTIEHTGYAGAKAQGWWLKHGGKVPVPRTVTEFLRRIDELKLPTEIQVRQEGPWFRVVAEKLCA